MEDPNSYNEKNSDKEETIEEFSANPNLEPKKNLGNNPVLWIIMFVLIIGVGISILIAIAQQAPKPIEVEPKEEVVMHELTEKEFQAILGNIFMVNEDGKYVVDENNNPIRIADYAYQQLQQQINQLKE